MRDILKFLTRFNRKFKQGVEIEKKKMKYGYRKLTLLKFKYLIAKVMKD
jgi:hypothetical protein